jgi:hypothetical protein
VSGTQIVILVLASCATWAEPPRADTTDYVIAGQDLSNWRKDVNDGDHLADPGLKKQSKPSQGVTALLMRVKREDGRVKEIEVFYIRVKEPKATPVREKPFTPADPDFKYLIKAVGLPQ